MDLARFPRHPLTFGPTPLEPLPRLSAHLGGKVEIWAKREDCNSGLAFGGNKTRKLEYLVPDALNYGWRDYGPRVGIWRMIESLDRYGIRASVLLNSMAATRYPQVIKAGVERNWAWLVKQVRVES